MCSLVTDEFLRSIWLQKSNDIFLLDFGCKKKCMIADDKQRIRIHFEQSKSLIFKKFPKNFSTEVVNTRLTNLDQYFV